MPKYNVVLQYQTGETVEKEYFVHWNPEKVNQEEVARACAAETTVAGGKNGDGSYKRPCIGLTALPV